MQRETEKFPKGLSNKEMRAVSFLEMEGKRFFSRKEIRQFFSSEGELALYLHRLKKKGRIERMGKDKYYLIPIQAHTGWAEHPFIVADEMFGGKDYYIGGKAAANYWGLTGQVPQVMDVFSRKMQGERKILGSSFKFRRVRKMGRAVERKISGHRFLVATRGESKKWKE